MREVPRHYDGDQKNDEGNQSNNFLTRGLHFRSSVGFSLTKTVISRTARPQEISK
jgi:hypothetical protein